MPSTINASNAAAGGLITTADASGQLELQTANTTRMTIDVNGNVGIGTNTNAKLEVYGSVANTISNAGTEDAATLAITNADVSGLGRIAKTLYQIGNLSCASISGVYSVFNGTNDIGGSLAFSTQTNAAGGVVERMRIDASGNVGIGLSPTYRLDVTSAASDFASKIVNSNASNPNALWLNFSGAAPNNTSRYFILAGDTSVSRFYVPSNGGVFNFSANNTNLSDERLKTDIQPAESYLDKICAIPVVTYLYKDQTDTERNLGVIAQNVDAIAPELVNHNGYGETQEGEDPLLGLYQTDIQFALMKSIQELKAIIDAQAERIAALEAK